DRAEDLACRFFPLQALGQPLLKITDPGVFALPRLGRLRALGFDLRLRGLRASTHRPLLTSQTCDIVRGVMRGYANAPGGARRAAGVPQARLRLADFPILN